MLKHKILEMNITESDIKIFHEGKLLTRLFNPATFDETLDEIRGRGWTLVPMTLASNVEG